MASLTEVLLCIFSPVINNSKQFLLISVSRRGGGGGGGGGGGSKMSSSKPLNKVFILDYISISLGLA